MCITTDKKILEIKKLFMKLNLDYINLGLSPKDLEKECFLTRTSYSYTRFGLFVVSVIVLLTCIIYQLDGFRVVLNYFLGVRCIIRNNYFVWEATRPISDCNFCKNVTRPLILPNVTRKEFAPYAYSSKPMVIKGAFLHWPARQIFSLQYFRDLYNSIDDAVRSVDEECQFLHFKSDFISLRDVFAMSNERVLNDPSEKSWYIGWGNCHPLILEEIRKHYPMPHFLPDDCEIPAKDYVFMGYDDGATMHLDFINRLMWQAQLQGSKTWYLHPPPECEHLCKELSFLVEPGDAVLVDTRVWYHATKITPGEFSVAIQSEYG